MTSTIGTLLLGLGWWLRRIISKTDELAAERNRMMVDQIAAATKGTADVAGQVVALSAQIAERTYNIDVRLVRVEERLSARPVVGGNRSYDPPE